MSKIVCIDAGHYKGYNASKVVKGYFEGDVMWKLHLYLKQELESYGIKVKTTRSNVSTDLSLSNRGKTSKGCDLFLSLHSNACDKESVDRAVIIGGLNSNSTFGTKIAECISQTMGLKDKRQYMTKESTKVKGKDYYGVLNGASLVNTKNRYIIEHSFHTNTRATKWLMSESNLKKLAIEEAKVIAEFLGCSKPSSNPSPTSYLVEVTANSLNVRSGAGTQYKVVGSVKKGEVYTIVQIKNNWGKLKSGLGWICLDYTKKR